MTVKYWALVAANLIARSIFRDKLPTYFHGELLWLSRGSWSSLHSAYEPYMARAIRAYLPRGGTFWDVGANIGLLSLFAAKVAGPTGQVLAFEPAPQVLAALRANTEGDNVRILPYGIGNSNGVQSFAAQGPSSAGSFVEAVTALNQRFHPEQPIEAVNVTMRTLDSVLGERISSDPTLVKIDVEGFEYEALLGARSLLTSSRPTLLIEIHPFQLALSGGSEDQLFALLRELRYSWSIIDRNPNSLYSILALAA